MASPMLRSQVSFLFFLVLLACLQGFASEIYAPSLLSIAQSFSVDENAIQSSIAVYLLASALFQLVYGSLSDNYGRKKCLVIGLSIFLAGCFFAVHAENQLSLLAARFLQGAGAAATASLWRAVFRDHFEGDDLIRYGGYLGTMMVVVVPFAPLLGGWLEVNYDWQSTFYFLMVYAILLLALIPLFVGNSMHEPDRQSTPFSTALKTLFANQYFTRYSLASFFTMTGFMAWFTAAPVIYLQRFELSPDEFGLIAFMTTAVCMLMGSVSVATLVGRFGGLMMMRMGLLISLLSGFAIVMSELEGWVSIPALIAMVFVYFYGSGFVWPAAFGGAMKSISEHTGLASAVYGTVQALGGYLGAQLIAYLPETTLFPLAALMILSPALALQMTARLSSKT